MLNESTNTFLVQQHSDSPANGLEAGDNFGFSIAEDSIVTVTMTPGENLEDMSLNVFGPNAPGEIGGQIISSEYINPDDTVVGTAPLPAGSYLITSTGAIQGFGSSTPVYDWSYTGSVTVVYIPVMSIGNATVGVSDRETTNANFTVFLSKPCSQTVTAIYTTADGSATASANDYQSASAYITFPPEQTNETVSITVNGGNLIGPEADFFVGLSQAMVGGLDVTIANATGTGTILNEDYPPAFQSPSQTNRTIQLSWSIVPGQTYQVQYNTNLTTTNWIDLGSPVTTTNTTACASDAMTNQQCFYRIRLVQ